MIVHSFLLATATLLSLLHPADSANSVKFYIVDSATGAPVAGASVCCADDTGSCRLCSNEGTVVIPASECSLLVTASGYVSLFINETVPDSNSGIVTVRLHRTDPIAALQKITVRGDRRSDHKRFATTSLTSFDRSALLSMPGSGNDINRVLSLQPSVVSLGTYNDNGIYVRGGSMSENAYVIDGIIFDNINHYSSVTEPGGSFGFIDMELVKKLDFYSGGIPASLPSRSSSVIDLTLRDGSLDSSIYTVKASVLGAGVSAEGPLARSRASYLLGVRFADMRFLNKFINESTRPQHGDGIVKLNVDMKNRGVLSLCTVGSFDRFILDHDTYTSLYDIETSYKVGNSAFALGATWDATVGQCSSTLHVSAKRTDVQQFREYSGTEDTLRWADTLWSHRERGFDGISIAENFMIAQEALLGKRIYTKSILDHTAELTEHISFNLGDHVSVSTGVSGEYRRMFLVSQWGVMRARYEVITGGEGNTAYSDTMYADTAKNAYDKNGTVVDYRGSGYCQMAVTAGPVSFVPGVRLDYHSIVGKTGISPRFGCTYTNNLIGNISTGLSMVRQLPTGFEGIVNYLVVVNNFGGATMLRKLELQRCFQEDVAWKKTFGSWLSAGVEGYYKWYDREYPLSSPYYRRVVEYYWDAEGNEAYRMRAADGKKKVYGGEVCVNGTLADRLDYSGAFTVFQSRNRYTNGNWYNDEYGLCRKGSLTAGYRFNSNHSLSIGLMALTGRYYTDYTRRNSGTGSSYTAPDYFKQQLEPIYSLSVKYGFTHHFRRMTAGGDIDLINILNQKIVIEKESYEDETPERRLDGILPIVGLWVTF